MSTANSTSRVDGPAALSALDRNVLQTLVEASQAISQRLDRAEVLRQITAYGARVFQADGASVLLHDAGRGELVFEAATTCEPDGPKSSLVGTRFDASLGIAGAVLAEGAAQRVNDVERDTHFYQGIDAQSGTRTRSVLAVPLIADGATLGVFEVINGYGGKGFTEDDLVVARVFANLAAAAIRNSESYEQQRRENRSRRRAEPSPQLIGESPPMRQMQALCRRVGSRDVTVLLQGETGAGKEEAARLVRACSRRAERPLVSVNCAALSETLLDSELFGHEKGAFTGATERRAGCFELAHGGTLFLDEVGEMTLPLQQKLLRVLETGEFYRVGGTRPVCCDVRLIAATNRRLEKEVERQQFREDLYYRLHVFPIEVPPLRDRREDIPRLVVHFAAQLAPQLDVPLPEFDERAMQRLTAYAWPGNVRQLRNVVERCLLLADGRITEDALPPEILASKAEPQQAEAHGDGDAGPRGATTATTLAGQERAMIVEALRAEGGNQSAAARRLGITRDNLRYRLKKHDIDPRACRRTDPAAMDD